MNHPLSIRSWWNATGKRTTRFAFTMLLAMTVSWSVFSYMKLYPERACGIGLLALTVLVISTIRQANRRGR